MLVAPVLVVILGAAPCAADGPVPAAVAAEEPQEAEVTPARRALAATAAGLGAGASLLLSLPLTVPFIYLGPLIGISPFVGALLVIGAVPVFVAVGSGLAASAFHSGIGPLVVGGAAALTGGLVTLIAGAILAPQNPDPTKPEFHLGVLSLVGVPTLAAAGAAAVTAPFFVEPAIGPDEIE